VNSQSITIQGNIINAEKNSIAGASIKLRYNDSLGFIRYFKIADEKGSFKLTFLNTTDKLWLQISALGYVTYNEQLSQPLFDINKPFILKIFTGQLPDVHVKSNTNISRHGDTTMYKVSAFERGNENNLGDLLKILPGISVSDNGKIIFNGKLIDKVLLEGDDLFGSNYSTLTNNTGTNGLERIDVIENYKDNSRIENSSIKGDETVINLRYKKKKVKLFGNINGAGGLPVENYELKTDWISLIPKTKFVITTNNNSLGNTANYLLGRENQLNALNNDDDKPVANAASTNNPVQFSDVAPLNMNAARTLFNTSWFATINTQIKLAKNLTLKAFTNLLTDDYKQTNSTIQTINNTTQPLTIIESNLLSKNNKQFDGGGEINWIPNNKFQSILKYRFSSINANHSKNGFLFSSPIQQYLRQSINQNQVQLITTKIFTGRKFLTSQFFYSNNKLSTDYTIQPPLYDTSFRYITNYQNLYQPINTPSTTIAGMVRFYSSMYKKSFAFQVAAIQNKYEFQNAAFVYNQNENLFPLPDTYKNSLSFIVNKQNFNSTLNYSIGEKIEVGAEGLVQFIQLKNNQEVRNYFTEEKKIFFLPSFSFKYRITAKKNLYLSLQTQVINPTISQLNQSFVFTGLTSVNSGVSQLRMSTGFTANVAYYYFEPILSGTIFSTYLFLSNNPVNYLQNYTNRGLYSFSVAELFNKNNQFATWGIRLEKNLSNSKTWLIISNNITQSKMYSYVNSQLNINQGLSIKTELRWKTQWDKLININSAFLYTYQSQNSFQSDIKVNSFTANALTSNTAINLNFFKKLNVDLLVDYLLNKPNNTSFKQIVFTDFQVAYPISKSIRIGFIARNIFNQKSFVENEIALNQNTISQFDLQPSFYLFTLGMRF
jgi:hypothetical protein